MFSQYVSCQSLADVNNIYLQNIDKSKNILEELKQSDDFVLFTAKVDHDIQEIEKVAKEIRNNYKKLIIIGTGGSSLNPQIFTALSDKKIEIEYLENIDPHTIDLTLKNLDVKNTAILCISKSGSTPETISQFLIMINYFSHVLPKSKTMVYNNFYVITEKTPNILRKIATEIGATILEHLPVGGRFATFTNVALLPACVGGLDIKKIRKGAADLLSSDNIEAAKGAALNLAAINSGYNINVIMSYIDRLEPLVNWQCQIWGESLGKNNKGSTPIKARGTIDQHSQLQLYLDGPKDKLFTLITNENLKNTGSKIEVPSHLRELSFLSGKTIGDLMAAEQQATLESLINNRSPVRNITIKNIDEETLGALAMNFILETHIFAKLVDIDPYGQPAVEAGKIRTKELISNV
ncbi:Glucose-6-phosphate isomerase [Candidatus Arcanobacter lacustris]|uniref:Glucose-6-phosphate isomerase n=1 Tax=Candidatus Arcanibacter lacustris TaxID=1607817 RepID=A0A0F5MQD7_9RICK|nr:Glucose-6-phosphate isomerase [Candidatus Arcanobacter lacustris]